MKQKTLILLLLAGWVFGEMDIPESGRVRIDGKLNDWSRADWTPVEAVIIGTPTNISNAVWSLAWDEDGILYVAVQYDDAQPVLRNGNKTFDCIELYARGDTSSEPLDFYDSQTSAQSYLTGLRTNQSTWIQMGPLKQLPKHNPIEVAVTLKENHFVYEAAVPIYDDFNPVDENDSSESELFTEREIGFDIAIIDIGENGPAGILGVNSRKKRTGADRIAEHTLED